jgi:dienelactone hydrolase
MALAHSRHEYSHDGQAFEANVFHPAGGARAGVLVCHAWAGQGEYEHDAARRLAHLGHVGIAIDVYGVGRRGNSNEENSALMTPLVRDRALLQARLKAALSFARTLPGVDATRMGAIGFCFGGLCALDMARMGADLRGVVAFHGLFGAPDTPRPERISASVLALHGWDDPMATPADVNAFAAEMTAARADWQLVAYGHTTHAFTNPAANSPEHGLSFNPTTRDRAWDACARFLAEVLA